MITCTNCGNQLPDGAAFCNNCGTPIAQAAPQGAPQGVPGQQPVYPAQPPVMAYDPWDHTLEFDRQDISDNKVFAMLPYLFSWIGVIVVMLAAQNSPYARFHARQYLKIAATEGILVLLMIIPILGWIVAGIGFLILFVLELIGFFGVCGGKAKEIPIIRGFGFMR